jgi:large subunit ribosomal protein L21
MYAIIEAGGKQHRVAMGEKLRIDLMKDKKKGDALVFDRVLMVGGDSYKIGQPLVANAKVNAVVSSMGSDGEGIKDKKVIVFKKKRRKGYQKSQGHRQRYTEIEITSIQA